MATVPAEIDANANLPQGQAAIAAGEGRSDTLFGFNRLTIMRQIGLMVGIAASVALGLAIVLWAQEPAYQPLLTDISRVDTAEVTNVLNQNDIPFKVEPRTGVLLVQADELYNARLKLAAAGLTENQAMGYEILDQEQGLGTSQFMETTRFKRGLEGELARTISNLRNVRNARVHLAIPKRSVFVRDARKPTASVFVEVFTGRVISEEQVAAIVNLVAGSVPEMNRQDVTVVDQKGQLLSRSDENSDARMAAKQFEYTQKLETKLNGRIASILEPILGSGRFRSEVAAQVDFTAIEEAEELFNPDMQALRSEQTLDEQRVSGEEGGIPGALANQPPADAAAPETGGAAGLVGDVGLASSNVRKQATRNYEVDRSISYTRHQPGKIQRLTVAVAIDDIRRINPETGEVTYTPWPQTEIDRLTLLVRNAVGYSAARGDSVNVINTPFAPEEIVTYEEPPLWKQPWLLDLIKKGVALIVLLILILGLVRPTLKSLAASGAQSRDLALAGDEEGLAQLDQLEASPALDSVSQAGDDFLLPGSSEGYDKQVNALKGLVAEDPARVAQVVRQWVNADD